MFVVLSADITGLNVDMDRTSKRIPCGKDRLEDQSGFCCALFCTN